MNSFLKNIIILIADVFDADACRNLLNDHYNYLFKLCEKTLPEDRSSAIKMAGEEECTQSVIGLGQLDAVELSTLVIDHLQDDDFKRLRSLKGLSSFKGFLNSVVNNVLIDTIRRRIGRSRAKERAKAFGEVGLGVYDLMVEKGHSADETAEILKTNHDISASADEVRSIYAVLWGRGEKNKKDPNVLVTQDCEGYFIVVEEKTPEEQVTDKDRKASLDQAFDELLEKMSGEERLIIRLRFPLDSITEPKKTKEIAACLGRSEASVSRDLRRILNKCREQMLAKGFSLDDLL